MGQQCQSGPQIALQLIGTPALHLAHAAAIRLERKDAALLALLALGGATPRARAAALLWPDADDDHARNSLRQRLFRLHRGAAANVVLTGDVLQLAPHVEHDVAALPARLEADPHAAAGALLGNLDYADCSELAEWVDSAREQWNTTRRDALAEIAGRLERERQIARGLLYAERLVAEDPFMEHAHRRVMRLHYLRGDRSAALAAYEHARAVLQRELQVEPGRETEELVRLIRGSGVHAPGTASRPTPRPVTILRPPHLVGRDAQWEQLQHAHAAHHVVLVSGEPGIGKTRLISDFAASVHGAAVFGARPGDARVPYALLARLIRGLTQQCGAPTTEWVALQLARVAPELGAAAGGRLEPLLLRQASEQALVQWRGAGIELIALDDLHFADEATLELLPALTAAQPLTWLLGARSEEMPAPVTQWLTADHTDSALRVVLAPLGQEAVQRLLESLAIPDFDAGAWAPPLTRHTGGNPLFILETLIALLAQGPHALRAAPLHLPSPANVGQLIERRLAQLSPPALALARAAAIAGQDFSVELAGAVLGKSTLELNDAWRELEAAHVIHGNAFAHDLIFEATLRSVPCAIARVMHRQIAAQLASREAPPMRLAIHWEKADAWDEAGTSFDTAAVGAAAVSRRAEEAQLRERAAACHERAGRRDHAFASRLASVAAVLFAQSHESAEALTRRLMADAQGDVQTLDALIAHANVLATATKSVEALAIARRAHELALATQDTLRELDAVCMLGYALAQQRQTAEAIDLLQTIKPRVQHSGDAARRYRYWSSLSYVLQIADRRSQCAQALAESIALAEELGDLGEVAITTANLSVINYNLGLPAQTHSAAERAYRLCHRLGDSTSITVGAIEINLGVSGCLLGRYAYALDMLGAALAKFDRGGGDQWRAVAQSHLCLTYLHLGQTARAGAALTPVGAGAKNSMRSRHLLLEARIARTSGSSGAAQLQQAIEVQRGAPDGLITMLADLDMSRGFEPQATAESCTAIRTRAERLEQFGVVIEARFVRVDALLRAGQASAAATEAREALAALQSHRPVDMYLPECWWIAFAALDAAGAEDEALACLRQAVDWIRNEALPNVPEEFRDGFLHRNPINRAVLTTAGRRLEG